MTDTLQLGDIIFEEFEIPPEMSLGIEHALKVHRFVGGKRIIDAMGADEKPITWGGRFRGPEALERAQAIKAMCKVGREVAMTWRALSYTVVVEIFDFRPQSAREVPYTIQLCVVRDEAQPETPPAEVSATEAVGEDVNTAEALTDLLEQAELDEQMDVLRDTVSGAGNLDIAPRGVLSGILDAAQTVQGTISTLIVAAETPLAAVGGVGGVVAGRSGRDLAAGLLASLSGMEDAATLYAAQGYVGRVEVNVGAIGVSGANVTVAGADLFRMAQTAYGDATMWSTIARANDLSDPLLAGVQEVTIPPTPTADGGVLD